MLKHFAALAICGVSVSACVPGAELVSPAVRGNVVNARTHLPVSGASVTVVKSGGAGSPVSMARGVSDARGRISVAARHQFGWVAIYGDYFTGEVLTLQVSKWGYQTFAHQDNYGFALLHSPLDIEAKLEPDRTPTRSKSF